MTAPTDTIRRAHALASDYPTMPAAQRLRLTRSTEDPPTYVAELAAGQTIERDGFTLSLTTVPDQDPDVSWLGEFTSTHEPGAIPNPDARHDRYAHDWFVPAITEDEHYRDLRGMKIGKAQARELARSYVRQDLETARDYAPVGAIVTATRAGIELGQASLWGIDDEDYARSWDVVGDLVADALHEARATLAELCTAPTERTDR